MTSEGLDRSQMKTFSVQLSVRPHEMAREEIRKQLAFLSKDLRGVRFSDDGDRIDFEAPEAAGASLANDVRALAVRVERALRNLERKIVFRSPACDSIRFSGSPNGEGIHFLGIGQAALQGVPLGLFRYFDRVFEEFGAAWKAVPLLTPTLIPDRVLARCDYFRSFPNNVTFACHLQEDAQIIDAFRARHQTQDELDRAALADMDRPNACLSPAVCYHVYHLSQDQVLPASGTVYGICGKCFRYESSNLSDLRRLWDFTMREVVFMGDRNYVLSRREESMDKMADFLSRHRLAGEIRTASDPFFIAPDAVSKTFFQLSSDSKFEISLLLDNNERLAVGSHNYHSDFFGRAFHTDVEGAGAMHSVCVAFGLERWVYAFLAQHGSKPSAWPDEVRRAPEFQRQFPA